MLIVGSPYIQQAEVNLDTGETGEWRVIWNGTGGLVRVPSVVAWAFPLTIRNRLPKDRISTARTAGTTCWLLKVGCPSRHGHDSELTIPQAALGSTTW